MLYKNCYGFIDDFLHEAKATRIGDDPEQLIATMSSEAQKRLASGNPYIACRLSQKGSLLTIFCLTESELTNSCETPLFLLPNDIAISSWEVKRRNVTLESLAGRNFFSIYIEAIIDSRTDTTKLKEYVPLIPHEISLYLRYPHFVRQLATFQGISFDLKRELCNTLLLYPEHFPGFFEEFQRFFLATTLDFKSLRSPRHLVKIVRSHFWLRNKLLQYESDQAKTVFFRLFRSTLIFPFGKKQVLSLAICIPSLAPYEQFDQRHIIDAVRRCIPTLEVVPNSFFIYRYAEESTISLYLELEHALPSPPSSEEIKQLKSELEQEFVGSIEHMVNRIDIPQNDDDLLRNILLLSQEITRINEKPHVIIQFHEQNTTTLTFYITLVRVLKVNGTSQLPLQSTAEGVRFIFLKASMLDTLKANYVKQGLEFLVQCPKAPFLRRDRSVDFLKAREEVIKYIETVFGKIRDLNGGFMHEHQRLFHSIAELLSPEETKEITLIERLIHSLTPSIMKSLLGPEQIVTVFRQLLALRKTPLSSPLVEEFDQQLYIGLIYPENFAKEDILHTPFHIPENHISICHTVCDGYPFCFVICSHKESEVRQKVAKWVEDLLQKHEQDSAANTLRISLPRPTLHLDPRIGADRVSGSVIKMLYEGLMRLDPTGRPVPGIAEQVAILSEGKTYTFMLRNSTWSNGKELTAHDFEYAWKKILDPSFPTIFDYLFYPIKNAKAVKLGSLPGDCLGVHAISNNILVVELEHPAPYFLELCCLWIYSPLCRDLDASNPGWAYYGDRAYVCNGPFTLSKWSRTHGIHLIKNERYWDKERLAIDQIEMKIIEKPQRALQLYDEGKLDWIGEPISEIPLANIRRKDPRIITEPVLAVQWFTLNTQNAPFKSSKVRRAFSYALDRKRLIQECLFGEERASHSILPSALSLLPPDNHLPYDPDYAVTLFKDGLEEQGLSKLRPLTMVINDQEPHTTVAKYIIGVWQEAFDISITLNILDWHEFISRRKSAPEDISGTVWCSWFRDPLYTFGVLKTPTTPMNGSKWKDATFTSLVEQAEKTTDKHQRRKLLKSAEQLIMREMPIIPVFDFNARYMKNDALNNIYVTPFGNIDFSWCSLNPKNAIEVVY